MKQKTSSFLLLLFRIVFTGFLIWTIWFIFHNSLQNGTVSSARSQAFTASFNALLSKAHLGHLSNAAVRKLAHFGEYTLLGFWYPLCLRVYTRRYVRYLCWPLFLGLLVALMDETVQYFISSRNSSIFDIWIDLGGVCCGLAVALVVLLLLRSLFLLMGFGREKS